jgi:DNA/RNA endonuclease G (NUC1)
VICGPVFFGKNPAVWLGQEGEVKAAVPDAFFKIVIRQEEGEDGETLIALAFVIPNVLPKKFKDPEEFLTTIAEVETLTGLTFLTSLGESKQEQIKGTVGSLDDWD